MAAHKGHKKYGGKKKGSKNKKTLEWEALGESIINEHAERFNHILSISADDVFMKYYIPVIEHFKPKLARTETSGDLNINMGISKETQEALQRLAKLAAKHEL